VQGSLDDPPIVITMSRWKTVLLFLLCMGFVVMGVWLVVKDPQKAIGYLCAGFFGLGIPVFIWRMLSPPRLELSRDGISWFTGAKTLKYPWSDFAAFRTYKPSGRGVSKYVGYLYAADHPGLGKMAAFTNAFAGVDGGFGGQWEMSADKVAALLNAAKGRWASLAP
jgi:hypothetical protein